MAIEITIPRLGWSMDEGVFGEWLKSDGEFVEAGEPVFTLESEKALQEVESVDSGYLSIISGGPAEGDTVTVGTLIAYLVEEGEVAPVTSTTPAIVDHTIPEVEPSAAAVATVVPSESRPAKTLSDIPPVRRNSVGAPAISPRAARLAQRVGVDWTKLDGSGITGRIRERDVKAAAGNAVDESRRPVGAVRRVIAEKMMATVRSTAPVTLTARVDATNLVALRKQYQASQSAAVPAYHDIVAKLAAAALKLHPVMNCLWTENGPVEPDGIHIGLAVNTDAGLLVPVIRNADKLSLIDLTVQSRNLIGRAKSRTCTPVELNGGTFSITNLGGFGIEFFTPILNSPQTAVLGLGSIRREAVVDQDDRIVSRSQLPLSLTFDHRVTDGAPAASFLQSLSKMIENPGPWLIG